MLQVINDSLDPYFNLALEEYILFNKPTDENHFILWQNQNAVVVGRNQNTIGEINQDFVHKQGIKVVRRLSGGGAVYHDLGNINFSFIVNEDQDFTNFIKFTQPVLATLKGLGVPAENNGRNDITIEGKKFSGNAQFKYKGRLLHHGTIMFNANIADMVQALNPGAAKISSKGIKSVRSRVTNISDYLAVPLTIKMFKQLLSEEILKQENNNEIYLLTARDKSEINRIRNSKYQTWAWNYGTSPACNAKKTGHYPWGNIDVNLEIKNGIIKGCKIFGDFFSGRDIKELEDCLTAAVYSEGEIRARLAGLDLASWFPEMSKDEFIKLIYG